MKVALLISGYTRTLELNINSLNDRILSKFNDVDIYLHITKDEIREDKYLNRPISVDKIKSLLNVKFLIEDQNFNFTENHSQNIVINSWFKYFKLNEIKREYEKENGKYDLVIKYRPDMNILSDINFEIKPDIIYLPNDSKIDKTKLKSKGDKYICDIFAYGDSDSMNNYFDIYRSLDFLFTHFGNVPETILYNYLNINNINFQMIDLKYNMILSLCNIFAISGDSGSGKTTIGNLLKKYFSGSFMLECDRYHKWERGDENWKNLTHLNPYSNYITKMNEDIFDLKIGKSIYQVDYDHTTGKFTEKEKIETSDNIIVCGLHSLYSDNDAVYNLKIFMDTDINLKYSWKIKRDVNERGYTLEKVLKQINDREEDYKNYILPQREKSDIIINFSTDDYFNLSDLDKDLNTYLNIYLNREIDISNLISIFLKYDVKLKLSEEDLFNKITFKEYKKCDLFNYTNLNNFYDYIVFIILNLYR
jgi:uridine kinase